MKSDYLMDTWHFYAILDLEISKLERADSFTILRTSKIPLNCTLELYAK